MSPSNRRCFRGAPGSVGAKLAGLTLALLFSSLVLGADHLPNAAAHIGTVLINQGDQFTANPTVALAIQAVNNGSGVTLMQFSNDGQAWSAPEPYATSRAWQLAADGLYPPGMSTVLKTVYVRFQDGTGTWSKAVTDSIVLARTAADIPPAQEIWIAQQTPPDFDPTQDPGSRQNPYLVPAPPNEPQFDAIMHSLMLAFRSYAPEAVTTNLLPPPPTNTPVPTVHLGPGVYQTHGDNRSLGDNAAWSPQNGWRLIGAGKDLTMLQMVDLAASPLRLLHVLGGYYGSVAHYDNLEVSDLTIDANLHEGGGNVQNRYSVAVLFVGNNIQLRRLRVKNFGTTIPGAEGYGLGMQNFGAAIGTYNLIIEDCDFVQAQVGNAYKSGMMGVSGEAGEDGNLRYYYNAMIRNCYVDGAAYDGNTPVDPMLHTFDDRGRYGLSNGGCIGGVVEDCLVINVVDGFYIDSTGLHDVTIRNNHFRNVFNGVHLVLGSSSFGTIRLEDTVRFENNLVELDPRLFPAGDNYGSSGWRYGFLFWGNLKGGEIYSYNHVVVTSNIFQFTDRGLPEAKVGGITGALQSFRNAEVMTNWFLGLSRPISWDDAPEYLDRQADFVDPTRTVPLVCRENRREDGTIVDCYPYVLDGELLRPSVLAGEEVRFPAPTLDGGPATAVSGVPAGAMIDAQNVFRWKTGPQDAGRYVIGFHSGTNRMSDPRYTMVTVLPGFSSADPFYFANGLAGYWKLDETDGTTLHDSSGNGIAIDAAPGLNFGFLTLGGAGLTAGEKAIQFSASPLGAAQVLLISNASPPIFTGLLPSYQPLMERESSLYHPFTITFWIKPAAEPQGAQLLFTDGGHFFIDVSPGTNTNNNCVVLQFISLQNVCAATPDTVSVGNWHHVAATFDGVTMRMYVDGAKAGELAIGQVLDWSADSRLWAGGGWGWQNYVGSMEKLGIWNRVLSDAEINRLRSDQAAGVSPVLTPLAPTALRALSDNAGSVSLSWEDNSFNESGFVVERSTNGSQFFVIASLGRNSTTFLDSVPQAGGTYFYRLAAINASGSSDYSNVAIGGPCQYALESIGTSLGPRAAAGTFTIMATAGCPWAASVSASCNWIRTASMGTGPGVVAFTVDANLTSQARSGSINLPGSVFTVTQTGAFIPQAATYSGLLAPPGTNAPGRAGAISVTTRTAGTFTGRLRLGAKSYSLSGKLDLGGHAQAHIHRSGLPDLLVDLQLDPLDTNALAGFVGDGTWTASFRGARAGFDGRTHLAPQAGCYTLITTCQPASVLEPGGDGYATVRVDKAGRIRLAGMLADGTVLSQSAAVAITGKWPLYVPLYRGQGAVLGWLTFTATATNDVSGILDWSRPSLANAKNFPAGFSLRTGVSGARYARPLPGSRLLALSNAQVVLSGGNLPENLTSTLAIDLNNRVTDLGGKNVKLTFTTSTGLFRGSIINPGGGPTLALKGAVLQKANFASGFFQNSGQSGRAYLGPVPGQ